MKQTVAWTIVACGLVVVLAAALVIARDIFLILALAVLFGVFLTRSSAALAARFSIPYGYALACVAAMPLVLGVLGGLFFGARLDRQYERASQHIDEAQEKLRQAAKESAMLDSLIASTPYLHEMIGGDATNSSPSPQKRSEVPEQDSSAAVPPPESSSASPAQEDATANAAATSPTPSLGDESASLERLQDTLNPDFAQQKLLRSTAARGIDIIGSIFQTTLGLLVNSMLIFFVGLFLATNPENYRDGIVSLFPVVRRSRAREVMNLVGDALWNWLIGRFCSMLVTGVGAGLLLFVLGVPMAISLGIATALLTFIPNIGGFIALALAILFAIPQGGGIILLVITGYLILQLIESYVVTPLIQQRQVSLPPALLIASQAVFGMIFGFLGAAVASPLLAAFKVTVEQVYIHDILEGGES